jgi:hypothetical protein
MSATGKREIIEHFPLTRYVTLFDNLLVDLPVVTRKATVIVRMGTSSFFLILPNPASRCFCSFLL